MHTVYRNVNTFCVLTTLGTGLTLLYFRPHLQGGLHCIVLHCTALHCYTLYCTILHYTVPHYSSLYCNTLFHNIKHCIALHCSTLPSTVLHCTTPQCTKLYRTPLFRTVLHCTVQQCNTSLTLYHFNILSSANVVSPVAAAQSVALRECHCLPLRATLARQY